MDVSSYVILALICLALMIDGVEYIFMCFLAICTSLEKCLFKSFPIFKLGYLVVFIVQSEDRVAA